MKKTLVTNESFNSIEFKAKDILKEDSYLPQWRYISVHTEDTICNDQFHFGVLVFRQHGFQICTKARSAC
jgi:hypothetical protein